MPEPATQTTDLRLLPNGHLIVDGGGPEFSTALRAPFSENSAAGLLALATEAIEESLPLAANYWRELGGEFFTRLCGAPPSELEAGKIDVPPPDEFWLLDFLAKAPPAPGMEYLNRDRLADFWAGMNAHAAAEIARDEGTLEEWLQKRNPLWRMVGRVTFHLAENKNNTEHPFAFLATYTHRLSKGGRLQYLPLGKALKEAAGKSDTRTLESLLAPVQAAAETTDLARELLDSKRVFHALAWGPGEAFRFIQAVPDLEEAGLIVKVPNWWQGGRPSRAKVGVQLDAKKADCLGFGDLLKFNVGATLDGENLTEAEWKAILDSSGNLISLRGRWVEVDRELLEQVMGHWQKAEAAAMRGELTFAQGMRMLAGFSGLALTGDPEIDAALEAGGDWAEISAGGVLKSALQKLRAPESEDGGIVPQTLKATLRPYQEDGLAWLWLTRSLGLGGCLADDMGLGKTIQVIGLLLKIKEENVGRLSRAVRSSSTAETSDRGSDGGSGEPSYDSENAHRPSIVVVPASLMGNWRAEIEKFAPTLSAFYAHSSQTDREFLERGNPEKTDVVITTYGMLGRLDFLLEADYELAVLDEAQAIKNARTAQTRRAKKLKSRSRLALTGTPIENSVADLWSLFDFINPGLLGSAARFKEVVSQQGASGFEGLRKLVSPYILRRLKTDKSIISDLPDKTEMPAICTLTKGQAALYQKSIQALGKDLATKQGIERSGLVLTYLMRMKQICNHPGLWTGSGNFLPKDSGKFKRLAELCEEIRSRGEKVLVFTQFREMTGPLADFLEGEACFGRPGLILHGGTAVKKRQQLVEQFQADGGPPFFVISLKAGGTGLNLTAASHVVHFDRWWNPAVENQATDRAFRIGQMRNVLVHKFVCQGTIEEKIDKIIGQKQNLADEILQPGGTEKMLTAMGDDELLDFVALDLEKVG
ncbi:MAG: DEAD/DEAH box helicase [Verrucomicrobiales bacterium]|nr:DEAD/DEAH box helicase [Verrucomicrobiales bacterium]